jgi:hypothetical protein
METKGTHDVQLPPTVDHQTPQCTSLAFKTSVDKFQPSPLNSKQTKKETCQYHDNYHWRLSRTIPETYLPNGFLQETLANTEANW